MASSLDLVLLQKQNGLSSYSNWHNALSSSSTTILFSIEMQSDLPWRAGVVSVLCLRLFKA